MLRKNDSFMNSLQSMRKLNFLMLEKTWNNSRDFQITFIRHMGANRFLCTPSWLFSLICRLVAQTGKAPMPGKESMGCASALATKESRSEWNSNKIRLQKIIWVPVTHNRFPEQCGSNLVIQSAHLVYSTPCAVGWDEHRQYVLRRTHHDPIQGQEAESGWTPVSDTHLTLPTMYSV